MPIVIPETLPAFGELQNEGIEVMTTSRAERQDIRPLRIALLNLMPNKIATETQFARLLGASPLQIELTLITTGSYTPKNVPEGHLSAFYQTWMDVKAQNQRFDGLIITGAPVETMPFEEVAYWQELRQIFDWATLNVFQTLAVCWGAQAALFHHYGVQKYLLSGKKMGLFAQQVKHPYHPCLNGFNDIFYIPVARETEILATDLSSTPCKILIDSDESGLCMVEDEKHRLLCIFNHWEYDTTSLALEYFRDRDAGKDVAMPVGYFPENNPDKTPLNTWRAHGALFFRNWLNQIYQNTPYDLKHL